MSLCAQIKAPIAHTATGAWKGGVPMVDHIWVVELESGKTYYRKTKREAESCGTPDDPVNKVYREDYCT